MANVEKQTLFMVRFMKWSTLVMVLLGAIVVAANFASYLESGSEDHLVTLIFSSSIWVVAVGVHLGCRFALKKLRK